MLTEFCVYTIASRDQLGPVALERGPFVNKESKNWKWAREQLEAVRASGRVLPILLADAKDCSHLLYWGRVEKIEIGKTHLGKTQTEYTVDRLRPLPGRHAPQELVLSFDGSSKSPCIGNGRAEEHVANKR